MQISCHFRDCKALLVTSMTHVSGATASVQTCLDLYAGGMLKGLGLRTYGFGVKGPSRRLDLKILALTTSLVKTT